MVGNWRSVGLVSIETAGVVLGLKRSATYEAVNRGQIPVMQVGSRKKVPTAWLKTIVDGVPSGSAA